MFAFMWFLPMLLLLGILIAGVTEYETLVKEQPYKTVLIKHQFWFSVGALGCFLACMGLYIALTPYMLILVTNTY